MKSAVGMFNMNRKIIWQRTGSGQRSPNQDQGISISFNSYMPLFRRRGKSQLQELLEENEISWLWQRGTDWFGSGYRQTEI